MDGGIKRETFHWFCIFCREDLNFCTCRLLPLDKNNTEMKPKPRKQDSSCTNLPGPNQLPTVATTAGHPVDWNAPATICHTQKVVLALHFTVQCFILHSYHGTMFILHSNHGTMFYITVKPWHTVLFYTLTMIHYNHYTSRYNASYCTPIMVQCLYYTLTIVQCFMLQSNHGTLFYFTL